MKLTDLLECISGGAEVWISTSEESEDCIYFGEVRFISKAVWKALGNHTVKEIYPEHYKAHYCHGITIILEKTEDMYGDFPTLEEIKRDYNELVEMVGNVTTIEQAREWNKKDKFTVEINGEFLEEYVRNGGADKDIEWIRYEAFGCLSYIYFWIKKGKVNRIVFDVWSNELEYDFLENCRIENVEEKYNAFMKDLED